MNTSIQFLHDPEYRDAVLLLILTPAGISFDPKEIGKNLFGNSVWTHETLSIDGLSPKAIFRYSDIGFHWTDFLDLAFRHVDHTLFFVPHKKTFKEIVKENLVHQNPDLYSFSFHKFACATRKVPARQEEKPAAVEMQPTVSSLPMREEGTREEGTKVDKVLPVGKSHTPSEKLTEARSALHSLLATGWSANAVSKATGITAMTIGSIRNGKSAQVSTRVYDALMKMHADASAGRTAPASRATAAAAVASPVHTVTPGNAHTTVPKTVRTSEKDPAEKELLVREKLVAVDAMKFSALLDTLVSVFSDGMNDLREMRALLTKGDGHG